MADFLIVRNKCDKATDYTNWIGEGLASYLRSKGHSVTDLSDADASPEKVSTWLGDGMTAKGAILCDHGSLNAFYGEKNGKLAQVLNSANAVGLTQSLHIYTLACSTNGDGGLGEAAVGGGCFSWLGYRTPVYAARSQSFKDCIWSYVRAMVEGKTMEECEQALRQAYAARTGQSFIYQYNLDRLLLRKRTTGMTIHSHNRTAVPELVYEALFVRMV